MRVYRGVRYQAVEEVPTLPWEIQGTIYDNLRDAKFAAAKLFTFCNNVGVVVKPVKDGWALLFWRRAGVIK